MRLHVKECPECRRCALKVDGEKEWHRKMVDVTLAKLRELHEIVSEAQQHCEVCDRRVVTQVAQTAGAVH